MGGSVQEGSAHGSTTMGTPKRNTAQYSMAQRGTAQRSVPRGRKSPRRPPRPRPGRRVRRPPGPPPPPLQSSLPRPPPGGTCGCNLRDQSWMIERQVNEALASTRLTRPRRAAAHPGRRRRAPSRLAASWRATKENSWALPLRRCSTTSKVALAPPARISSTDRICECGRNSAGCTGATGLRLAVGATVWLGQQDWETARATRALRTHRLQEAQRGGQGVQEPLLGLHMRLHACTGTAGAAADLRCRDCAVWGTSGQPCAAPIRCTPQSALPAHLPPCQPTGRLRRRDSRSRWG